MRTLIEQSEACQTHAARIAYLAEMSAAKETHIGDIPTRIGDIPTRIAYHEACMRNLGLTQAEIYWWVHRVPQVPFADAD